MYEHIRQFTKYLFDINYINMIIDTIFYLIKLIKKAFKNKVIVKHNTK